MAVSTSYTTRAPRGNEVDGVAYHFVDDDEFERMIDQDEFLEWAEVHGKRYGSGKAETEKLLANGLDVLFDIDVQGGQQIKRAAPNAMLVFLLPPSIEELTRRLSCRGTESSDQVETRLRNAVWELKQGWAYDCHVINDVLESAVELVDGIRKGILKDSCKHEQILDFLIEEAVKRLD